MGDGYQNLCQKNRAYWQVVEKDCGSSAKLSENFGVLILSAMDSGTASAMLSWVKEKWIEW